MAIKVDAQWVVEHAEEAAGCAGPATQASEIPPFAQENKIRTWSSSAFEQFRRDTANQRY